MKILFVLLVSALSLQAQSKYIRVADSINAMIVSNPAQIHTNVFVVGKGFYTFYSGNSDATNNFDCFATTSTNTPGRYKLGPQFGSTNVYSTTIITNLYVTNLTVMNLAENYRTKTLTDGITADLLIWTFANDQTSSYAFIDGIVQINNSTNLSIQGFTMNIAAARNDADGGCIANSDLALTEFYQPAGGLLLDDGAGSFTGVTSVTNQITSTALFGGVTGTTLYYRVRTFGPATVTFAP